MAAERRASRDLEEKAAWNEGYPAWQAYCRQCREEAKAASAKKEAMSQPSQPRVVIDPGDGALTSGGAGH
jgi:hypothetical protein